MELQTEISFWRNPACFGTRSWPTGHTAGNACGPSCFLGCERAIWPMTSALIIRASYAQTCQVSGKNKPMTPHTTPPHPTLPKPSSTSDLWDLSLGANLEQDPEAKEGQRPPLCRSHHQGGIPEQTAGASGSILTPSHMASEVYGGERGYIGLSLVPEYITWHHMGVFHFRFLDQPVCFVTPWNQVVRRGHLNHVHRVCFPTPRYSWHKISQWLFFKAGFPLRLPTGCSPKLVIVSKKSSTGWPSNIGHRKGSS